MASVHPFFFFFCLDSKLQDVSPALSRFPPWQQVGSPPFVLLTAETFRHFSHCRHLPFKCRRFPKVHPGDSFLLSNFERPPELSPLRARVPPNPDSFPIAHSEKYKTKPQLPSRTKSSTLVVTDSWPYFPSDRFFIPLSIPPSRFTGTTNGGTRVSLYRDLVVQLPSSPLSSKLIVICDCPVLPFFFSFVRQLFSFGLRRPVFNQHCLLSPPFLLSSFLSLGACLPCRL